jgi:hypothetical protein
MTPAVLNRLVEDVLTPTIDALYYNTYYVDAAAQRINLRGY